VKEEAAIGGSLALMNTRWTLGQPNRNELSHLWRIEVRAHEYVVKLECDFVPRRSKDDAARRPI
jgi:hypothetical protein